MQPYPIRLPDGLRADLEAEADERNMSLAEHIRTVLRQRNTQENTQRNTQENTQPNTSLTELEARVSTLEAEFGKSTVNTETPTGGTDLQPSSPYPSGPQSAPLDRGKTLNERMNEKLDELHVPGRKAAVERTRRDAIAFAWEYLRDQGEATSSEIANATFGQFFVDDDLGYSTSSRYPGYQLWDSAVRDRLVELPGVEPPGPRGSVYRFEED